LSRFLECGKNTTLYTKHARPKGTLHRGNMASNYGVTAGNAFSFLSYGWGRMSGDLSQRGDTPWRSLGQIHSLLRNARSSS
jgi:hypothetical protein